MKWSLAPAIVYPFLADDAQQRPALVLRRASAALQGLPSKRALQRGTGSPQTNPCPDGTMPEGLI
jgi:hypothetical protein